MENAELLEQNAQLRAPLHLSLHSVTIFPAFRQLNSFWEPEKEWRGYVW